VGGRISVRCRRCRAQCDGAARPLRRLHYRRDNPRPDEDNREVVRLGTIVITGAEASDACDGSIFNPAKLAEGIDHPPDDIFVERRAAYTFSLIRRSLSQGRRSKIGVMSSGQCCICKFISSVCAAIFSFKLAMITSDPARTRNTMSTPNASARILLVLSGPVVM
jgi:hypothetical protein